MATDVVQTTSGNRVTAYFNDVVAEMRKVTWPDRAQLKDTTIKIIIFVLLLGAIIAVDRCVTPDGACARYPVAVR